jgi:hypothetical protein
VSTQHPNPFLRVHNASPANVADRETVHRGEYSVRPNMEESMVFMKKLVSRQQQGGLVVLRSPPDGPMRKLPSIASLLFQHVPHSRCLSIVRSSEEYEASSESDCRIRQFPSGQFREQRGRDGPNLQRARRGFRFAGKARVDRRSKVHLRNPRTKKGHLLP